MVAIQVPNDYGYVLLSVISTFVTGIYLGMRVTSFRSVAKIPYPYEYASYEQVQSAAPERKAQMNTFNAAQRGHQNFIENQSSTIGSLLICGLAHPKVAAVLGAAWSVSRVLYSVGYTHWNQNGNGRLAGFGAVLIQFILPFWAASVAWGLITK